MPGLGNFPKVRVSASKFSSRLCSLRDAVKVGRRGLDSSERDLLTEYVSPDKLESLVAVSLITT